MHHFFPSLGHRMHPLSASTPRIVCESPRIPHAFRRCLGRISKGEVSNTSPQALPASAGLNRLTSGDCYVPCMRQSGSGTVLCHADRSGHPVRDALKSGVVDLMRACGSRTCCKSLRDCGKLSEQFRKKILFCLNRGCAVVSPVHHSTRPFPPETGVYTLQSLVLFQAFSHFFRMAL